MSDGLVIAYPLIVKPSQGWASEGVTKVTNEVELFAAVAALEPVRPGTQIIIETYLDGPESMPILCCKTIRFSSTS